MQYLQDNKSQNIQVVYAPICLKISHVLSTYNSSHLFCNRWQNCVSTWFLYHLLPPTHSLIWICLIYIFKKKIQENSKLYLVLFILLITFQSFFCALDESPLANSLHFSVFNSYTDVYIVKASRWLHMLNAQW